MEALLIHVASILNRRPLAVRRFSDHDFVAITPNDLLLGKNQADPDMLLSDVAVDDDDVASFSNRLEKVHEKARAWWSRWFADVFPLLTPRKKWMNIQENIQVGDIVMVKTERKIGKGDFRLARVQTVHLDPHGIVRTVTVGLRNCRKGAREKPEELKSGLVDMVVPVQRLVMLLPISEDWTDEPGAQNID